MEKVVLITGGARGIGRQIAKTFAESGYIVVVNYNRSGNLARSLQQEFDNKGLVSYFVKADISNERQVAKMIDSIIAKYGSIDVLVNNAATTNDSLFADKTANTFNRVLATNLVGTFNVSKLVGQIMFNNKYGKIINISSTNGDNTYFPMCVEYDASKAGLDSLTHNLAIQFAPYVNVNAIAPGFIATESETKDMDEEFIATEVDKVLLKRAGTEQDVANIVEFLASDKASYINNQIIKVNGGYYGD